ncbi:hypothetical protein [Spartinivicinus poritis]|uniref:Uncharacterized protein n=1 Tax=Spartinivicinus poritis TaxID=2994640 RepID=A0ABT5UHA0_9GAMM|nr:hypothetical protein [Spartinivicinus sp. A2-2]MDE1464877.1 hypothetical protein [Spartinivicinus sp. A2-2]
MKSIQPLPALNIIAESVTQLETQSFLKKSSQPRFRLTEEGSSLFERSIRRGSTHFQSVELKNLVSSVRVIQNNPSLDSAKKAVEALDLWVSLNPAEWNERGGLTDILRDELISNFGVSSTLAPAVKKVIDYSVQYRKLPSAENKRKLIEAVISWKVDIKLNPDKSMQLALKGSYLDMLKSDVKNYLASLEKKYQQLNLKPNPNDQKAREIKYKSFSGSEGYSLPKVDGFWLSLGYLVDMESGDFIDSIGDLLESIGDAVLDAV